jgi:TonB family protein
VTNEQIVSSVSVSERADTFEADPIVPPSFASFENAERSGGSWFLKIALILAVVAAGGYFAWQQPQVRQYVQKLLHRSSGATATAPASEADDPILSQPTTQAATAQPPLENGSSLSEGQNAVQPAAPTNFSSTDAQDSAATGAVHAAGKAGSIETIEVQELPMGRDSGKVTVTPKVEPILVKNGTAVKKFSQPAAPSLEAVADAANATLPDLTPANIALPRPAPGTIRISQGVSQGLLVKKVQPVYPNIAQQFHREGSVQVLATVGKDGEVKKVQVLNGDSMLAKAAVDAVNKWEYRPYLLNGQPVEIETQITIIFKAR